MKYQDSSGSSLHHQVINERLASIVTIVISLDQIIGSLQPMMQRLIKTRSFSTEKLTIFSKSYYLSRMKLSTD